jgi:hypothetical protein
MGSLAWVVAVAVAGQVYAVDPQLSAEAKASPVADRWLTLDRSVLTGGVSRGGHPLEDSWDAAFSDVAASLPHAQRGHAFQIAARVEFYGGFATTLAGAGLLLVRMFVPSAGAVGWGALTAVLLGTVGNLLGIIHARTARSELLEAIRLHNGAVNDALPEDQRLDLQEFGPPPITPPPSAAR